MKPTLIAEDYARAAVALNVPDSRVIAVTKVEARSKGFDDNDQPIILFERHKFWAFTSGKYADDHPDICNKMPGGYSSNNTSEWIRLQKAMALDETAAMKSASYGLFQIMGFNYAVCGFDYVQDFFHAMQESEADHLDAFVRFVKAASNRPMLLALQRGDAQAFAKLYNGPNYVVNKYDTKLKAEGF